MADSKLRDLTATTTLTDDAIVYVVNDVGGTPVNRKITASNLATQISTKLSLGTAAQADTGDFATAAQGSTADTAVQPGDIGTAAAEDVGYFATAAQGGLADTALQPSGGVMTGDLVGHTDTDYTTARFRNITLSALDPSGGNNGDIWIKYQA